MRYAFVLGRVYTLSIAELSAILEKQDSSLGLDGTPARPPSTEAEGNGRQVKILECSPEILIIETQVPLNAEKLQKKLGGVIKILEVVDMVKKREAESINFALKHYFRPGILKKQFFKEYKGKVQFGLSIYLLSMDLLKSPASPGSRDKQSHGSFNSIFSEPKRLGMMIKKGLTDTGASVRLVLPEFNSLSLASVVVTKNLLLQKGAEICLLAGKDRVYTAKTVAVQDFEDYGRRDYQRPARDEKQGMIPPKVAQIMLNLSACKTNDTILDPFCGIGTILQEGILLGYKMLGCDINKKAIKGSEQNLEWFRNRYKISPRKYHVETADARKIASLLETQKISAVVTEGTLGPIYGKYPTQTEIKANFDDLTKLYQACLAEFNKILPSKGRIVMCIPAYKKSRDLYEMLPSLDFATPLGYNLVDIISPVLAKKMKFLKFTNRGTAIYDRKDQVVAREIVIFEKA